jgi:hypothetical protein
MCLFKKDEQENSCFHEECKNYYQLNKQICMYSRQNQEVKRPKLNEEQNLLELLQKKIKKEVDLKSAPQENSTQPSYGQSFTLNSTMLPTQMIQVKTEAPTPTGIFFQQPSYQQHIPQIQPSYYMPVPEVNGPTNYSNMNLAQMVNMRNQNNTESSMTNVVKLSENVNNTQSIENSLRDFQSKLLNLVLSQNKILVDLKEKNDVIQDTLGCLVGEVAELKKSIKPSALEPLLQNGKPPLITQIIGNSSDVINSDNLLTYLYGANREFQYQLVLKQELSLPLYRERNFKFTVLLVDKEGKPVENLNSIPLTIGIYSSENPPKYIDTNTSGNKILKGFLEKDLKNGTVTFEKVQIKEVSSHFRNGWIFFVVYPKVSAGANMANVDGSFNFVNSQKIKPLVLEKVVVKAKKSKEKGTSVENEENMQEESE